MNKKGLSNVITWVLTLLFVLAAAVIIWAFVQKVFVEGGEAAEAEIIFSGVGFRIVPGTLSVNAQNDVSFLLERVSGEGAISGFIVVLEDTSGNAFSDQSQTLTPFNVFERIAISIPASNHGLEEDIRKISIHATYVNDRGKLYASHYPKGTLEVTPEILAQAGGGSGGSGGGSCVPTTELCDGADNDCNPSTADGSADPAIGVVQNCGIGACAVSVTSECVNGVIVGTQCVPGSAIPEVCGMLGTTCNCNDEIDNDCDTFVDLADSGCSNVANLQNGLLLELLFEDSISDGIASDTSGNGNNGLCSVGVNCPTEIMGHNDIGNAYRFDGLQWLDAGNFDGIEGLTTISFSFWATMPGSENQESTDVIAGKCNSGGFPNKNLELIWDSEERLGVTLYSDTLSATVVADEPCTIEDMHWHYFVGVYNGSAIRLYLDGELQNNSVTFSHPLSLNPNAQLYIGSEQSCGLQNWNGSIDDFRIWNRSLTQQEVNFLFNN